MENKNETRQSKADSVAMVTEQYQLALRELNNLQQEFQKEYHRLLDLLQQGNIDTVLQIIDHRKALICIKK